MTTLLVASTGGHLAQLARLRRRLVPEDEPVAWATFDTPQSRSLLRDERAYFVRYVAPRDWRSVAVNLTAARRILADVRPTRLVTTGSGIALSFVPLARAMRVQCEYVESAARSDGPSLTGRIVSRVPGVKTFTQYRSWSSNRWPLTVSVFDCYAAQPVVARPLQTAVVTLGTIEGYSFISLVDRLLKLLPAETEVLWQTGDTDVTGRGIEAHRTLPSHVLDEAMAKADLVVAHSGIGSVLAALDSGRTPLIVPRRAVRGEHVDDHQVQIARELSQRGLIVYRELEDLSTDDLLLAASGRVVQTS